MEMEKRELRIENGLAKGMEIEMADIQRKFFTSVIIIIGLFLMLIGAKIPHLQLAGVQLGTFMTNLGLYFAVVASLQWFFDHNSRHHLIKEMTELTITNLNVANSGLADFNLNTKKISYEEMLENKSPLVIGFQYSPGFIDAHIVGLTNRAKTGKKTTVLLANPDGEAIQYYYSHDEKNSAHIKPELEKVRRKIRKLNSENSIKEPIVVLCHNVILRYSFVGNEDGVWVKFYKNSKGTAIIPGLYVRKKSNLFDFFNEDIKGLIDEVSNVKT